MVSQVLFPIQSPFEMVEDMSTPVVLACCGALGAMPSSQAATDVAQLLEAVILAFQTLISTVSRAVHITRTPIQQSGLVQQMPWQKWVTPRCRFEFLKHIKVGQKSRIHLQCLLQSIRLL